MLTAIEAAIVALSVALMVWAVVQIGPTLMPGYEECGGVE